MKTLCIHGSVYSDFKFLTKFAKVTQKNFGGACSGLYLGLNTQKLPFKITIRAKSGHFVILPKGGGQGIPSPSRGVLATFLRPFIPVAMTSLPDAHLHFQFFIRPSSRRQNKRNQIPMPLLVRSMVTSAFQALRRIAHHIHIVVRACQGAKGKMCLRPAMVICAAR